MHHYNYSMGSLTIYISRTENIPQHGRIFLTHPNLPGHQDDEDLSRETLCNYCKLLTAVLRQLHAQTKAWRNEREGEETLGG